MKQLISGNIIDGIFKLFEKKSEQPTVDDLAKWLSHFQISSKTGFENRAAEPAPLVAVLLNLMQRGTPTRLNLYALEEIVKSSTLLQMDEDNLVSIDVGFKTHVQELKELVLRSLHIIDPRLNRQNLNIKYQQSWENLGSEFEESFLFDKLPQALNERLKGHADFLIQLLATQRSIRSIIDGKIDHQVLADSVKNNFYEQRTDFSMEFPYSANNKPRGIVIEIDGSQHQQSAQQYLDTERDRAVTKSGWDNTLRIRTSDFQGKALTEKLNNIFLPAITNEYIRNCFKNYVNPLWINPITQEVLEISLIPFAVARIQRTMLEAIMHQRIPLNRESIRMAVIERDVPCAKLAIDDLTKLIESLNGLTEQPLNLPAIELEVFTSQEFAQSRFQKAKTKPLHLFSPSEDYDLVIDIAVLERSQNPTIVSTNAAEAISIRSSHYIESERKVFTGDLISFKPFCSKIDNTDVWEVIDSGMKSHLEYLLQSVFRKKKYRDGQLPIMHNALQCKSVIGLLPTGGGKSLTYQLSAFLQPGICLVIDPIRSLMKDQVDGFLRNLIDSCVFINSSLQGEEKRKAMRKLAEGKVQFVFISPERLQMEEFRNLLGDMHEANIFFSYCVIDEAHCVSEWGHDFRTAYLRLGENAIKYCKTKNIRSLPLFGLTATASYDVLADVQRELSGSDERNRLTEDAIIRAEFTKRHELQYVIEEVSFSEKDIRNIWGLKGALGGTKQARVKELINHIPQQIPDFMGNPMKVFPEVAWQENKEKEKESFEKMQIEDYDPESFFQTNNAALIFCPHTKGIFGVTDKFKIDKQGTPAERNGYFDLLSTQDGVKAGYFMGGSNDTDATNSIMVESFDNQTSFINGELNLMVATKAFGMGIDKENIRYTIHINYPGSIESYVQEAGRAGRDGKMALSYILFNDQEVVLKEEEKTIDHDLEINMYFHRNSFKGELKELAILDELLTEIHFPDRTFELEALIANELDLDVKCNYWEGGHNKRLYVNLGFKEKLGFLDLNTLNYNDNDTVNSTFSDQVSELLSNYISNLHLNEPAYRWIQRSDKMIGIEEILKTKQKGEQFQLTVGFYNNAKERIKTITRWLKEAVHNDFNEGLVQIMRINCTDADAFIEQVCENHKKFTKRELDFETHCKQRDKFKNNPPGTAQRMFMELYNGYRDKMDTEKAIYRLSSLGIIDDYTVNFSSNTFTLRGRKKTEAEYRKHLKNYLLKYFSEKTTEAKLERINHIHESTPLRQYLHFLVFFVYENIKNKRQQAIHDIKSACREALDKGDEGPVWLKDFIDLYFNSKYARVGYEYTNTTGKSLNASLADLTEQGKSDNLELVWFFMQVMDEDQSGSQIDNFKHLRGACTRMSTSILEPLFSIRMLHAFSLYMLEFRNKRYLEEAEMHLFEAFGILQVKEKHLKEKDLRKIFNRFISEVNERNSLLQSFMEQHQMEFDFDSIMIQRYLEPLQKASHTLRSINEILN